MAVTLKSSCDDCLVNIGQPSRRKKGHAAVGLMHVSAVGKQVEAEQANTIQGHAKRRGPVCTTRHEASRMLTRVKLSDYVTGRPAHIDIAARGAHHR